MPSRVRQLLALLVIAVCALDLLRLADARPNMARYTRDREDMAKTLTFLRKLDDYYSNVARPRFGKRASEPAYFDTIEVDEETPVYGGPLIRRR
ncbi:hypothetical protein FJT64_002333 [Amphibalanus amphitrite]|uniref:Pro-neuropeptide Y n=1 Tax=Amphibalanus amphitrite TaxID=1232801 RepID=A0A6A4WY35_AMPAM|nr:neuropeptide F-like [Amphibalanus amphitrite]XP_043202697.1 neuropeptide F-like [Amphibalanus amphitrite]KAF0307031.1 hypothetical protein FJT64_002333 [Amphibalanus amphitrite]